MQLQFTAPGTCHIGKTKIVVLTIGRHMPRYGIYRTAPASLGLKERPKRRNGELVGCAVRPQRAHSVRPKALPLGQIAR